MPANEDTHQHERRGGELAELRSDMRHLQSDVTDIKADVRATNQRIDKLSEKLDAEVKGLNNKIDAEVKRLSDKLDEKTTGLSKEIASVGKSVESTKVWVVILTSTIAGSLLYVMAHGFKWL